jgi:Protein of unknown function (DUF3592)
MLNGEDTREGFSMDYLGLGMLALGILWIAGFGYAHFRAVGKAKAAEAWPTATGRVISSEVVEEESTDREGATSTWYDPVVTYAYSAGGRELTGRRLRFGNYRSPAARRPKPRSSPTRLEPRRRSATIPKIQRNACLRRRSPGLST